jgi:6-phosphofructokinase 1
MLGNVIVGQSGGPTSVINSSLAGVIKTAKDRGAGKVYGMRHGIKGLLDRQYVDLSEKIRTTMEIELLKRTPSSYLGSCRYKLPEIRDDQATYEKIFEILNELEIKYFFYIGGNDSMDTIKKLADYSVLIGSDIKFMGVPKTIDNDLAVTDHTPGYGSAAKFIAATMKEIIRDGLVYDYPTVTIVEIMGRNAG